MFSTTCVIILLLHITIILYTLRDDRTRQWYRSWDPMKCILLYFYPSDFQQYFLHMHFVHISSHKYSNYKTKQKIALPQNVIRISWKYYEMLHMCKIGHKMSWKYNKCNICVKNRSCKNVRSKCSQNITKRDLCITQIGRTKMSITKCYIYGENIHNEMSPKYHKYYIYVQKSITKCL